MKQHFRAIGLILAIAAVGACAGEGPLGPPGSPPPGSPPPPPPPPPPAGSDIALGRAAVQRECASCHASQDGFDLAFFSYSDTTIIRRAVKHVDTTTARRIVAYIRSLNTPHVAENIALFQPGGRTVADDAQFAIGVFGQDAWPALTTAQLLAINPATTPVAMVMPEWSDEGSNLDWLPDSAPPPSILAYAGNRAQTALAAYHATPTKANLDLAIAALGAAEKDAANPSAPCLFNSPSRVNYVVCFELRRWTASLIAQHMLRSGVTQSLGALAHRQWWAVGETARKAQMAGSPVPIANATRNQIDWMYLGWIFEPGHHESFYLENLLTGRGLRRHATFVALRSQVSRPANSWGEHESIYDGLRTGVRHAPNAWTAAVARFSLTHILERLNGGDKPPAPANRSYAITQIDLAVTEAGAKVSASDLTALKALAAQVKAKL